MNLMMNEKLFFAPWQHEKVRKSEKKVASLTFSLLSACESLFLISWCNIWVTCVFKGELVPLNLKGKEASESHFSQVDAHRKGILMS